MIGQVGDPHRIADGIAHRTAKWPFHAHAAQGDSASQLMVDLIEPAKAERLVEGYGVQRGVELKPLEARLSRGLEHGLREPSPHAPARERRKHVDRSDRGRLQVELRVGDRLTLGCRDEEAARGDPFRKPGRSVRLRPGIDLRTAVAGLDRCAAYGGLVDRGDGRGVAWAGFSDGDLRVACPAACAWPPAASRSRPRAPSSAATPRSISSRSASATIS